MRPADHNPTRGLVVVVGLAALLATMPTWAETTTRRFEQGRLRYHDGLPVVTLRGSPYEMGYQHGILLRAEVRASVADTLAFARRYLKTRWLTDTMLDVIWWMERPFIPEDYLVELRGLSDGSGVSLTALERVHAIPDLLSGGCSSFVAFGRSTADGRVLHSRNLDWNIEAGIQHHAALFVVHPDGPDKRSFVSVGYAGFIGVLTGVNSRGISVAQIGAKTADRTLKGLPMPFLLRAVLERSQQLDDAVALVRAAHRTVGYNYVFADAQRHDAVALETTRHLCAVCRPNDPREASVSYAVTVPDALVRADTALDPSVRERQWASKGNPRQPGLEPPGGAAYDVRYRRQGDALRAAFGTLTVERALAIMQAAAPPSNVQRVLFAYPNLWVANAHDLSPAVTQPYHHFNIRALLGLVPRRRR